MRPIRKRLTAAGTYYIPVDRNRTETVLVATLSGLTMTSVSWTNENVRSGAAPQDGGPVNNPENAVAAASAAWTAMAAQTDGSYRFSFPLDTLRVIVGGAGTGVLAINQETAAGFVGADI